MENSFEILWNHLLSRDPSLVKSAFASLSQEEQDYVVDHLRDMANEEGWHPEQVKSARAALEIINIQGV